MSRTIVTSAGKDRHHDRGPNGSRANEARSGTQDSGRSAWLQQARAHLRTNDLVLARLIDDRPAFDPRAWMDQLPQMDLYGALLFQITGQQLSVPATRRTPHHALGPLTSFSDGR